MAINDGYEWTIQVSTLRERGTCPSLAAVREHHDGRAVALFTSGSEQNYEGTLALCSAFGLDHVEVSRALQVEAWREAAESAGAALGAGKSPITAETVAVAFDALGRYARVDLDAEGRTTVERILREASERRRRALEQAKAAGAEDGRYAVQEYLQTEGVEALREACRPGSGSWDDPAINAGAHTSAGIPSDRQDLRSAYYEAYAQAANQHAQAVLAGAAWAEREAEALNGSPSGAWKSDAALALPLVDGLVERALDDEERRALADVVNTAARDRWDELAE